MYSNQKRKELDGIEEEIAERQRQIIQQIEEYNITVDDLDAKNRILYLIIQLHLSCLKID